ncbi:hypothetical protein [Acinetobacter ursingii]|uniref:hypothetical protein n=1 Tax=Acinetobacter ursingii TaxID=108980 RepID=UPI0012500E4A|nr:hypothetical protein [Acinetobacter ursingii]
MNYFKFKLLVTEYRNEKKLEISNFAIKHNYECFISGETTPLIEAVEEFHKKPLANCIQEKKESKYPEKYSPRRSNFNDISHLILDPSQNKPTKLHTSMLVIEQNKEFYIDYCHKHGQTLFKVRQTDVNHSFCCICKYGHSREIEIKNALNKYWEGRQANLVAI